MFNKTNPEVLVREAMSKDGSDCAKSPSAVKISVETQSANQKHQAALSIQMENPETIIGKVLDILAAKFPIQAFFDVLANHQDYTRTAVENSASPMTPNTLTSTVNNEMLKDAVKMIPGDVTPKAGAALTSWLRDAIGALSAEELIDVTTTISPRNSRALAKALVEKVGQHHDDGSSSVASTGKWESGIDSIMLADRETEHSNNPDKESVSMVSYYSETSAVSIESNWSTEVIEFVLRMDSDSLSTLVIDAVERKGTNPEEEAVYTLIRQNPRFRAWVDSQVESRKRLYDQQRKSHVNAAASNFERSLITKNSETPISSHTTQFSTSHQLNTRGVTTNAMSTIEESRKVNKESVSSYNKHLRSQQDTVPNSENKTMEEQKNLSASISSSSHCPKIHQSVNKANMSKPDPLHSTLWLTHIESGLISERNQIRRICKHRILTALRMLKVPDKRVGAVRNETSICLLQKHLDLWRTVTNGVKNHFFSITLSMCEELGFDANLEVENNIPVLTDEQVLPLLLSSEEEDVFRFIQEATIRMSIHRVAYNLETISSTRVCTETLNQLLGVPENQRNLQSQEWLKNTIHCARRQYLTESLNETVEELQWEPLKAQNLLGFVESFFKGSERSKSDGTIREVPRLIESESIDIKTATGRVSFWSNAVCKSNVGAQSQIPLVPPMTQTANLAVFAGPAV